MLFAQGPYFISVVVYPRLHGGTDYWRPAKKYMFMIKVNEHSIAFILAFIQSPKNSGRGWYCRGFIRDSVTETRRRWFFLNTTRVTRSHPLSHPSHLFSHPSSASLSRPSRPPGVDDHVGASTIWSNDCLERLYFRGGYLKAMTGLLPCHGSRVDCICVKGVFADRRDFMCLLEREFSG